MEAASDLSADEELLFAAIGNGIKRSTLRKRIYLSEYPFREALMALREKGLVDLSLSVPTAEAPAIQSRAEREPIIISEPINLGTSRRPAKIGIVARINQFMLQSSLAPEILVIALLGGALVVPLLFWKETFLQF